jgi:Flp pilus assembly protein TadD
VLCTLLAIASKPTAVSTPFILLALDAGIAAGSWRVALARRWPLHAASFATLALLAAFGVVEGVLRDDSGMTGFGLGVAGTTPAGYAALSLRALGLYGALVVWPPLLAIDRGVEALSAWWMPVAGVAILAAMLTLTVLGARRRAWWWTLPACAMLALLPTTSVVPLADAAVDHRMYLPLVAVAVGLAALGARAPRAAATTLLAAALGAETFATVRRVGDFADPVGLWSEVVAASPTHARGYINRSMHLLELQRDDEATADLLVAERLMPGNPSVQTNLAILEIRRGKPADALRRLDVVATRTRGDAAVLGARGDALRALGAPREAAANYALAAERAPSVALYPLLEGNALAELGDDAGALAAFARAASRASRDDGLRASAHFNIGNMHYRAGRIDDARDSYRRALADDPTHAEARRWLRETEDFDGS